MKNKIICMLLSFMLTMLTTTAQNGPTMGWSSWNTYFSNISEDLIKQQANAIVSKGLRSLGYNHINIDDGYFGGRNKETGELLLHPQRFPNGLKPVVDYIHSKGLKAGIYSDAGANTCANYYGGDVLSVDVGFYRYDQHDADFFFKECGFDFIKVDFCGGDAPQNSQRLSLDPQERYTAISKAIKNTGRDDVRLNVCRWNYPGTWVHDIAFSWRTTPDINNSWGSIKSILSENLYMSAYCFDGRFNDMDMLEVGRGMSVEEDRTHFGMWCIMCSPLLIGCDMRTLSGDPLTLLRNRELIALNQDPLYLQAYPVAIDNDCFILVKDIEELHGTKRAFAIYNPNDDAKEVTVNFEDLELGGSVTLRNAMLRKDQGTFTDGTFSAKIPAHGTRIFVATCENRLERKRYEAETGYISDYQEIKNNQSERTGIYSSDANCSCGYKAGWLGYSEKNDLLWRDVYSKEGGDYTLTIGYLCGENRNITVSVNGKKIKNISANSGGWNKVGTSSTRITLNKGSNVVRLSNTSSWMPDIDYIDVVPVVPSAINTINEDKADNKTYDIQGREIKSADNPGIYIQNGKKILKTK